MGILDFFTGGGEYADPNAIDERYGVSKGDVRQAALNTLGNVSGLLLAAGQPMSGSQRAQLLGQLGPAFGGAQTDIYNAAQRRLLGAENEQKMAEMQRMRAFAERVQRDPEGVARELGTTADVIKDLTPAQLQTIAANKATAAINVTPGERAMREALSKISTTVSQDEALSGGGGGPTVEAQALLGKKKPQAKLIAQYSEAIPKLLGMGYVKEAGELSDILKGMAPAAAETVTVPQGSSVIDKATGAVIFANAAEPRSFTLSPGQIVVSEGKTIAQGPAEQQDRPLTPAERAAYNIAPDVPAVMTKTGPKVLTSTGSNAPSGYRLIPDPDNPDGPPILEVIEGGPGTVLPADLAGKTAVAEAFFLIGTPQIEDAINQGLFANDNYAFRAQLQLGVGEAGNIIRQFKLGQEAIRRVLSGAALSATEVEDYVSRYLPSSTDSEKTIKQKYGDLKTTVTEIREAVLTGRASQAEIKNIMNKKRPSEPDAIPAKGNAAQEPTDDELIIKYGGN